MPSMDTESQFKFLISCIKHSTAGKVNFSAVANELQIVSKAAAAKRYERLMKSHGVNPSGGNSATTADPDLTKGKGKAAPSPKTPKAVKTPKGAKKRKIDDNQDDDEEDQDIKPEIKVEGKSKIKSEVKSEPKNEDLGDKNIKELKDIKTTKPKTLTKLEKLNKWIDQGSLSMNSIPEAPQTMLDATHRNDGSDVAVAAAPAVEDDDDDSCVVVGVTNLVNGTSVGTIPVEHGARRPALILETLSAPILMPPVQSPQAMDFSSSTSTVPSTPVSALPTPTSAPAPLAPMIRTPTMLLSNPYSTPGLVQSSNSHAHASSSPVSNFTAHHPQHTSPPAQSLPPASWTHSPSPHSFFWNFRQDSNNSGGHHQGF